MKRFTTLALMLALLFLTSCQAEEEEPPFTLTVQQQESLTQQIDAVVEEYYWSYDGDSCSFFGGTVPEDTAENEGVFLASQACEFPLKRQAGNQAVIAQSTLLHYNGDTAGKLTAYFVGDTLCGVLYYGGYNEAPYSLLERNPFLADGRFSGFENWQGTSSAYREQTGNLPQEGFGATHTDGNGKSYAVSIVDGKARIYHLSGKTLSLYRTLSMGSNEATSSGFIDNADGSFLLAVLYGGVSVEEDTEEGTTAGDTTAGGTTAGDSTLPATIVFYNSRFERVNELVLDDAFGSAICGDGEDLLVFSQSRVEVYNEGADGWVSEKSHNLRHRVSKCHVTDLDGNGVKEYLMTDGMDLYVYQPSDGKTMEGGLKQIWSTHLGVESLYGCLYSGDLNHDGVKEIYVCDATGTTIRYILTQKGLRSSNEDIDYGQAIYPFDWNADGIDDYWMIQPAGVGLQSSVFLSTGE